MTSNKKKFLLFRVRTQLRILTSTQGASDREEEDEKEEEEEEH